MGIEFVDLSPRLAAELRDVVDESQEKTQALKLRFAGTTQILCTRALPTADGFQFTTALPFLRAETEVDITLSPDAQVGTKGWVSAVSLDRAQADGVPRLVIDIRAAPHGAGALPEGLWEPRDFTATNETPPGFQRIDVEESASTGVPAAALPAMSFEPPQDDRGPGDPDQPEIVRSSNLFPPKSRPRAAPRVHTLAFAAPALAVVAVAIAWALRTAPPRAVAPRPIPSAVIVTLKPPPVAAAGTSTSPPRVATADPPVALPAGPYSGTPQFTVGLVGSLSGAEEYPLHAPDGVAFNLPHAQATMDVGTYRPAVKGLRAVWVRDLPGGGTHLRFFYTKSRPVPEVQLHSDGVSVAAR